MRSAAHPTQQGGYTLVEIVVVLLILGVAAAAAAPAFSEARRSDEVESGAQEVAGLMQKARLTAVERGTTAVVIIDPATGRYWVDLEDGSDTRRLAEGVFRLAPNVGMRGNAPRLVYRFDPVGPASGEPLVIIGGPGRTSVVEVDPWTGDPRVQTR